VEDEEDVDDINPTRCETNNEQKDFLFEVSVIFRDEFISNDSILMEAILELLTRLWENQGIMCLKGLVILLR
jgi:hypothetical protein